MAFDYFEKSRFSGKPITLFEFTYGEDDGLFFRFNDGRTEYTALDGRKYDPYPIKRSEIKLSGSSDRSLVTITTSILNPIAELYRVRPPSSVVRVIISETHLSDPEKETKVRWVGKVDQCAWENSELSLTCSPASSSLQRNGVRATWSLGCRHALYSSGEFECKVKRADWTTQGVVQDIRGTTVLLAGAWAKPNMKYVGGLFMWKNGLQKASRSIVGQDATQPALLTINGMVEGLKIGDLATVAPGCNHLLEDCIKFDNAPNFGGQPHIPSKNPVGRRSFWY